MASGRDTLNFVLLDDLSQQLRQMESELQQGAFTPSVAQVEAQGTLTATGAEQIVVLSSHPNPFTLNGWIDLSALGPGEEVIVRQSGRLPTIVGWKQYAQETYKGPVVSPLLFVESKPGALGLKVTLQQTVGPLRKFPFQFYRR